MNETIIRRALRESVDEEFANEPEAAGFYYKILRQMREGYFDSEHVDRLGQRWPGRAELDVYDAYAFAQLHSALGTGAIASVLVGVGSEPSADAARAENQTKLRRVPKPFVAAFAGGAGDDDGVLRWSSEIRTSRWTDAGKPTARHTAHPVPAGCAPLEVGYTNFWRSYAHLRMERSLARWPYGQDKITLFCVVDESWLLPRDGDPTHVAERSAEPANPETIP